MSVQTGASFIAQIVTVFEVAGAPVVSPSLGTTVAYHTSSHTVTICAINEAPVWTDIPDSLFHINEDSEENTVDISGYITDETADMLISFTVTANSDPGHLSAGFVGSNLILTTVVPNYFSTVSISLTLEAESNTVVFDGEISAFPSPICPPLLVFPVPCNMDFTSPSKFPFESIAPMPSPNPLPNSFPK
jgi:hypothetical protein